mmetsp:Transcript_42974/g.90269  ORF Transcript_42974/g.90269 Transcript_42974/m.90269 type:complete len:517 (-) Transcript_42974:431-1981(-)
MMSNSHRNKNRLDPLRASKNKCNHLQFAPFNCGTWIRPHPSRSCLLVLVIICIYSLADSRADATAASTATFLTYTDEVRGLHPYCSSQRDGLSSSRNWSHSYQRRKAKDDWDRHFRGKIKCGSQNCAFVTPVPSKTMAATAMTTTALRVKVKSFDDMILQHGNTPLLIDFYAPWCGPCKLMKGELSTIRPQLEKMGPLRVDSPAVDENETNTEEDSETADEADISSSSSSSSSSSRMPSGSAYIPPSRANSNRSPPMANTASAPTYSSVPPPYIPPSPASSMSPPSPVAAAMPQAQRRRIFGLPRGDQYSFLPVPQALDFSSRSDRYAIPTSLSTPPALSQAHWEQVDDLHDEFFCLSEGASSEPDNSLESAHFADNVDVGSTQAGELGYGEHVTVQSGCTGHEYAYEYASEPTVLCMSIWEDMKFLPLLDSVEKMLEEEVDELIENEGKALIKSLNAVFKETKCVIDLESEADTIVCTCGHQCINHANVSSNIRRCPLCRCPVTAFVRANGLIIF